MSGWKRYRQLAAIPGASSLVLVSVLARMPLGILSLLMLLDVTAERSLSEGGMALAAFSLCSAAASPLRGRLADRVGSAVVLRVCGVSQAAAIVLFAVAVSRGADQTGVVASAGLCGALLPPAGPVVRTAWPVLVPERKLSLAAFSLDALLLQVIYYAVGPPLAAAMAASIGARSGLLVVAAITLTGSVALANLASVRAIRPRPGAIRDRHWAGPLRRPAVVAVLATTFLSATAIAALETTVVAYTLQRSQAEWSGPLLAMLGFGSIAGGLWQGSRSAPRPLSVQYPRWLFGLCAGALSGWAALKVVGDAPFGTWALGAVLVVVGLTVAPISTCQFGEVGTLAPPGTVTEGFTWLFSVSLAGNALGTAASSGVAEYAGAATAMLVSVAVSLTASVSATAQMITTDRATRPASDPQG